MNVFTSRVKGGSRVSRSPFKNRKVNVLVKSSAMFKDVFFIKAAHNLPFQSAKKGLVTLNFSITKLFSSGTQVVKHTLKRDEVHT